jgi:hypothetical protein
MKKLQIKENDVYTWRYTKEHVEKLRFMSDLYHCKERLAVVKKGNDGVLTFYDTFWGVGRTDNYWFSLEDVGVKYEIEYYCNLDEIEKQPQHKEIKKYYKDEDIFMLHDQHACVQSCVYYYLKKGAEKSKDKMLNIVKNQIKEIENKIEWSKGDLKRANETLQKLEAAKDLDQFYL